MKEKYVFENKIVEKFMSDVDNTLMLLEIIKKDIETDDRKRFSAEYLSNAIGGNGENINGIQPDVIEFLINKLKELKMNVKHINSRKIICPALPIFMSLMKISDPLELAIVTKIIKDTYENSKMNNGYLVESLDSYGNAYSFLAEVASCLKDGFIKDEDIKEFAFYFQGYLLCVAKIGESTIDDLVVNAELVACFKKMIVLTGAFNLDQLKKFSDNYQTKYHKMLIKEENELVKKEYKANLEKAYTEIKELEYYIKGGVVLHLCPMRTFNQLLIRNKYSDKAIASLLKQMKKAIEMSEDDVYNALMSSYLASIDEKYQKMWEEIVAARKINPEISISDIKSDFLIVGGFLEGYGYADCDLDYFMLDALEEAYKKVIDKKMELNLVKTL